MNKYGHFNAGISICRIIMSFFVVCCHFSAFNLATYAVPVFMFLSFFLASHIFMGNKYKKIATKTFRLLVPFWGWGIIYYIIETRLYDKEISKNELGWQLLLGHSPVINQALWYLFDEIFIILIVTIFFVFIKKKEHRIILLVSLIVVSFLLQYTELNYQMFGWMDYKLRYPLGRIAEMVPCAMCGILLGQMEWNKVEYKYLLVICSVLFVVAYGFHYTSIEGFAYSGIQMVICAICIGLIAICAPIKKCKITTYINYLATHTLGIYCMHNVIGEWIENLYIPDPRIMLSIIIYVVCLVLAIVISLVPIKFVKMMVQ